MTHEPKSQRCPAAEELSAFALGELPPARAEVVLAHVSGCAMCAEHVRVLRELDAKLAGLRPPRPPAGAVLRVRRGLAPILRAKVQPEVMTLPEVARFLRVSLEELAEVAAQLPAFELGGQLRVRRESLMKWVERRERVYARSTVQSEVAGILSGNA